MRNVLLVAVVMALTAGVACHPGPPNTDVRPRGTISGRLTVGGADVAVNRRVVTAFDGVTGRTYRTRTNAVGDYTFLLPPGRYTLDVTLAPRETLAGPNPVVDLHGDDIKADVNIPIVVRRAP